MNNCDKKYTPKCTQCGSVHLSPTTELENNDGEKYVCRDCGKRVCRPPLYHADGTVWDARQTAFKIYFMCGGFFSGYPSVTIQKTTNGIELELIPPRRLLFLESNNQITRTKHQLSEDEWTCIIHELFDKLYIHEWSSEYKNLNVCDGTQWELKVEMINSVISIYGSNQFPPYWAELRELFDKYMLKKDL